MTPLAPGWIPSERQQLVVDENLEFAMAVPEDRIIFEVIEFAERHRDGTAPALRHEGQNSVRKETATLRRSFSLYQQRSETGVGKWNRNPRIFYQRVIYAADVGIGQHVVGALNRRQLSFGCVLLLKLQAPEPIGETQFLVSHVLRQTKNVVESRLAWPRRFPIGGKEVVANHPARNVDGVDAKATFGDLNTHARFFSLVQLLQCSITSLDLVDIGSPQRRLPDVHLGVRSRSPGGRRHQDLVTG